MSIPNTNRRKPPSAGPAGGTSRKKDRGLWRRFMDWLAKGPERDIPGRGACSS